MFAGSSSASPSSTAEASLHALGIPARRTSNTARGRLHCLAERMLPADESSERCRGGGGASTTLDHFLFH
jgi:hypothetical protein